MVIFGFLCIKKKKNICLPFLLSLSFFTCFNHLIFPSMHIAGHSFFIVDKILYLDLCILKSCMSLSSAFSLPERWLWQKTICVYLFHALIYISSYLMRKGKFIYSKSSKLGYCLLFFYLMICNSCIYKHFFNITVLAIICTWLIRIVVYS